MARGFFTRLFRHLLILPSAVKSHFPADVMQGIEDAIAKSELAHTGEIRFVVEANLHILDVFRRKSAKKRAIEVFSNLHIWDTEKNNGVLIYLLLADRDFEILADRGIHARVGGEAWESICNQMEKLFKQGQFEAGVLHGVTEISQHLTQHFPAGNHQNINELSNAPVIL